MAEISQVYEVDNEAFVKVFTRFMHVFFDTSKNAQRLFEVVLWKVGADKEKDVIYLHAKEADRYHRSARDWGTAPHPSTVPLMNSSAKASSPAAPCPICSGSIPRCSGTAIGCSSSPNYAEHPRSCPPKNDDRARTTQSDGAGRQGRGRLSMEFVSPVPAVVHCRRVGRCRA